MKIYLVGGAVRDELLDRPVTERDWVVVGASVEQMLALGYEQVGKDFPVFLHPRTHEEYALARTERKSGQGYTGFVCHADEHVTLEEDLLRRDLTINAMAKDEQGIITDPYGGQQDLAARQLRHVSAAFVEDPLRVLRVARFAARYAYLGFTVAADTLTLMRQLSHSGELDALVAERVWKETARALMEHDAATYFAVLAACEALPRLFSGLEHLPATTTAQLTLATSLTLPLEARAALLCQAHEQGLQWCDDLRMPGDCKQLAQLLTQYHPLHQEAQTSSEADIWLTLLERTDALRRPERFAIFIECSVLLQITAEPQPPSLQQASLAELRAQINQELALWAARLAALKALDIGALAKSGLKGQPLIDAIRQIRLKALEHQH